MIKKALLIFYTSIIATLLSSCGMIQPTPQQLSENVGPFPENYQELVSARIASHLLDPYSVHFDFVAPPERGWQNRYGKLYIGWRGQVGVNAKNAYGAYVGLRHYDYVIRNGRVIFSDENLLNKLNRTPVGGY